MLQLPSDDDSEYSLPVIDDVPGPTTSSPKASCSDRMDTLQGKHWSSVISRIHGSQGQQKYKVCASSMAD